MNVPVAPHPFLFDRALIRWSCKKFIYLIKVFEFKVAYYLISLLENVGYKGTTLSFQTSLEMCFFLLFPEQSDQSFTNFLCSKKTSFWFH